MREVVEGSAAVQERGPFERITLYDETFERGEYTEKYKESFSSMIAKTTRLLHQKLIVGGRAYFGTKVSQDEVSIVFYWRLTTDTTS